MHNEVENMHISNAVAVDATIIETIGDLQTAFRDKPFSEFTLLEIYCPGHATEIQCRCERWIGVTGTLREMKHN
jgi:hypothetical protein